MLHPGDVGSVEVNDKQCVPNIGLSVSGNQLALGHSGAPSQSRTRDPKYTHRCVIFLICYVCHVFL